jgi:hypothetical protein
LPDFNSTYTIRSSCAVKRAYSSCLELRSEARGTSTPSTDGEPIALSKRELPRSRSEKARLAFRAWMSVYLGFVNEWGEMELSLMTRTEILN